MKRVSYFLVLILALGFLSSCKKEEGLDTGTVPVIKFKSISPSTVRQYKDSVLITIEYTDGDGDLGENTTGVTNAYVTDSRNNLTYGFRIRQLAPDKNPISLKGTLVIEVPATALINSSATDENLSFNVFVKDRAGHASNTISTSQIKVVP
jgi:hypothetical protein